MQITNSFERYGIVTQLIHWLIVVLILTQFVTASIVEDMPPGMEKAAWMVRHEGVGITILIFAVIRLIWRWLNPVPELAEDTPIYQKHLARAVHIGLYGLIFLLPVSGWLASSFDGIPVSYFTWFEFPDLFAADKEWGELTKEVHDTLVGLLVLLAGLHVVAALKHHCVDKDNTLRRMLPFSR